MRDDQVLRPADAAAQHAAWIGGGCVVFWTVCQNPTDYPGKFTARPTTVGDVTGTHRAVLVADSLDAVREALPPGLHRFARDERDDPVIIESWMG